MCKEILSIFISIVFLLFTLIIIVNAAAVNQSLPTNVPSSISPVTPAGSVSEIDLLKQQVRLMKEFQESILKTVYYCLGTVGALAILLVGYNWWTTNRIYERDKEALKKDIINTQEQTHLAFDKSVSEKLTTGLAATEEKYLKFSQETSEKINKRLAVSEEKYLELRDETGETLQSFRSELDSQLRAFIKTSLSDLEARVNQNIATKTQEQNNQIVSLEKKLLIQTFELYGSIGKDHEEKKLWSAAYTCYFKSLESAVKLDWEFWINPAFDNCIRSLKNGATLTKPEKSEADKLIEKVQDKFKIQIATFSELVRKAPIFS